MPTTSTGADELVCFDQPDEWGEWLDWFQTFVTFLTEAHAVRFDELQESGSEPPRLELCSVQPLTSVVQRWQTFLGQYPAEPLRWEFSAIHADYERLEQRLLAQAVADGVDVHARMAGLFNQVHDSVVIDSTTAMQQAFGRILRQDLGPAARVPLSAEVALKGWKGE